MKCFLLVFAVISLGRAEVHGDDDPERTQDKRSIEGYGIYPGPQLIHQHVEVEKHVPIVRVQGYPVPVPQPVAFPVHVPVQVPHPVPVHVPVHVPVYKTVTIPVEKPVPYAVEKPFPVEVIKKIPIAVPKPYPVPVPVYKTKHIFHEVIHSKRHGWW